MLLKAGRYADAEKVFRADLAKNIGNPRSLYGLYRSLEGQKKAAAAETKASFDKAWAGADVTLGDDLIRHATLIAFARMKRRGTMKRISLLC